MSWGAPTIPAAYPVPGALQALGTLWGRPTWLGPSCASFPRGSRCCTLVVPWGRPQAQREGWPCQGQCRTSCRPRTYVLRPEVDARASPLLPEPPPLADGQPV